MQKTTALWGLFSRRRGPGGLQQQNVSFFMKVSLVVMISLLISAQLLQARDGFGQQMNDREITLELKSASLRTALNRIEKLSGIKLAYILEQVSRYDDINLPKDTRSVSATLQLILATTDLNFRMDKNIVLIYPKEKNTSTVAADELPEAQTKPVHGKVTNEKGEPVSGVSIYVKGNPSIGTVTDENGNYSLEIPEKATTIVFSSVGMETSEVAIAGRSEINTTLQVKVL